MSSELASNQRSSRERVHKRSRRLKIYLGLVISIACVWFVVNSVEKQKFVELLRNVHLGYLSIAVLITFLSYVLRSFRWPFFFDSSAPSFKASFDCVIIGFFVNNILPARIGEFVRAHLGGKATKLSRSTVLATIAGERLADGLMISLLFAVLFSFKSSVSEASDVKELYLVAYLFLAAAVLTILMLIFRGFLFRILESMQKVMPGNFSRYSLLRVRYFIEGLTPLLRPGKVIVLLVLSSIVWLVELSAYYFVTLAFSSPLGLGELSLFLAAVNFSSLIPAAPAGAGVIEWFGSLALQRIGVDGATALAMVATQHIIQIGVVGVPGLWLFLMRLGGKIPTGEEEDLIDQEVGGIDSFVDVSEPRPLEPSSESEESIGVEVVGQLVDISVVIPAFNEEDRIEATLSSIVNYFSTRDNSYEVLVVDDGSTDKTIDVVKRVQEQNPEVRFLGYPKNRGKGYAVRFGMLNSLGKIILFNDADGASPIEELSRLEAAINSGADIAIGSRAMYSRDTSVETVLYRKLIGRTFNGIVNLLLLPGIADTQCGFKLFKREIARHIFSRQKAERFSFDVEILFLARKSGCRIVEVPINWHNIPGSKVNLIKDSLDMFCDLLRFRLRDIFGGYGNLQFEKGKAIE